MRWAVAMGYRTDNPCERVTATPGRQRRVVRHVRALPHAEFGEAMATVRASGATTAAKLAFEFLVLTAARSGEVRAGAVGTRSTSTTRSGLSPPSA